MWRLISLRLGALIAVMALLAWSHLSAYRAGEAQSQLKCNAQSAAQAKESFQVSERYRAKEKDYQTKVRKVSNDYAAQKKINARLAAELDDSLHWLQSAISVTLAADISTDDRPAPTGNYGPTGLEQQLLGNCAVTLVELAKAADGLEAQVIALQSYINGIQP